MGTDAGSDLFALGVTLYQLLSLGRLPYGEVVPYQLGRYHRDPVAPSRRNPGVPIWLDQIALKAVARQTGQNILFTPQSIAGVSAPALRGEMSGKDAVDALLKGTNLEAAPDGDDGLIVRTTRSAQRGENARPAGIQLASLTGDVGATGRSSGRGDDAFESGKAGSGFRPKSGSGGGLTVPGTDQTSV